MNKRLHTINRLLTEYALGRFTNSLPISPRLDEIDAISNGINMLAEELRATTISRDYFNSIFNSVSDMVFVVHRSGRIREMNRAARQWLCPSGSQEIPDQTLAACLGQSAAWYRNIRTRLTRQPAVSLDNLELSLSNGRQLPVAITAVLTQLGGQELLLVTATDTSYRVRSENLVLRAIIDTQEKERQRLAQDLHDSIAQQLSGIRFALSSLQAGMQEPKQKQVLRHSNSGLSRLITELRSICFNLMPKTLEEFGLLQAVQEFHTQALFRPKMNLQVKATAPLPRLEPELSIDLYRIIQEFMANACKHGQATRVAIRLEPVGGLLKISLKDNGGGFDPARRSEGMGLQNVRSRLRSHRAALRIRSLPGKGVRFDIAVPINRQS